MSSRLVPCVACNRHVRTSAEACPFCLVPRALAAREEEPLPLLPARMGSLAVMTFRAAALGVALNACGGEAEKPKPTGQGGSTAQGGSSANAGAPPDTSSGGANATGGGTSEGTGGVTGISGAPNNNTGGGPTPIYRATPRG